MEFKPLPFDAGLKDYEQQAADLLASYQAGDAKTLQLIHHRHPRFLDEKIPWLPKKLSEDEIRGAGFDIVDARLTIARGYEFKDWRSLEDHVARVSEPDSPAHHFEAAVEAVIHGELETLRSQLRRFPDLVRARSSRVCCFDPPVHRATLLHYIAANGVEGYRQRTPANAVDVARELLSAGAEVDALADMYGGRCTTMSMLVSSSPPADAGLQIPLALTLLDFGATVEESGEGPWRSPLMTALTFGFLATAEALVARGAKVNDIAAAAGLGRVEDVRRLLPESGAEGRHRAFALAAQLGHAAVVELLLDAGEDPNRYNPEGGHAHATPLHQAVWGGHAMVVRLLVEHGAQLDLKDRIYQSTPLGWAVYGGKQEIADYLRSKGAE